MFPSSSSGVSPSSVVDFLALCRNLKVYSFFSLWCWYFLRMLHWFNGFGSWEQTTKRTGWVRRGVCGPESVADHMYRMGIMALIAPDIPGINRDRFLLYPPWFVVFLFLIYLILVVIVSVFFPPWADASRWPLCMILLKVGFFTDIYYYYCHFLNVFINVLMWRYWWKNKTFKNVAIVGDITPFDGVSKSEKSRMEKEALDHMCKLLGGESRGEIYRQTCKTIDWIFKNFGSCISENYRLLIDDGVV